MGYRITKWYETSWFRSEVDTSWSWECKIPPLVWRTIETPDDPVFDARTILVKDCRVHLGVEWSGYDKTFSVTLDRVEVAFDVSDWKRFYFHRDDRPSYSGGVWQLKLGPIRITLDAPWEDSKRSYRT